MCAKVPVTGGADNRPAPSILAPVTRTKQPVALTIAGSDSGGGAGIQADLKTFAALSVHGTSAITCVTAQNPRGVLGIQACRPEMVGLQLQAIFAELPPAAIKTGMLYSEPTIEMVCGFLRNCRGPLIVDPVMVATSGARLLKPGAVRALTRQLLPIAALATPNLPEAEALLGHAVRSPTELRQAAREFHDRFGCAALIKGGHLPRGKEAVDYYYDGRDELTLAAPFIKGVSTHGTGCTYAAAIAGYCAQGHPLPQAVELAKQYISQAITQSLAARGHGVLNHLWQWRRVQGRESDDFAHFL